MRKRHMLLVVGGLSLVGFATPNALLTIINHSNAAKESAPVESLQQRESKFRAGLDGSSGQAKINYLNETKAAITRQLQEDGKSGFEVSKIVFTSEKSKWVAGQKQVQLSFTYQLQYQNGKPQKLNGTILLASDEAGNMFNSSIKI